jgi:predicted amidohydrolase
MMRPSTPLVLLPLLAVVALANADDATTDCRAELQREKALRLKLEVQLREVKARLAAAEQRGGAATVCEYAADHSTNVSGLDGTTAMTTCEQFPSGGDMTFSSSAPLADGVFAVDVRAMTYSAAPKKDNTKFRRIVACSMAVGWAGNICGQNLTCSLGRLEQISNFWDKAGARQCDIALLPEDFFGYTTQPVETYIAAMGPIAKKHNMYLAAGGHVIPKDYNSSVYHRTSDPDNKYGYNTAILVDRQGEYVGEYHKQFPVGSPGDGWPGRGGTVVFDLDFGRVAMLTCFDMNFQEAWFSAYAQDVDVMLWPSAYGGGMNMRAYAALFGLRVIPAGIGDITDITGRVAEGHKCAYTIARHHSHQTTLGYLSTS